MLLSHRSVISRQVYDPTGFERDSGLTLVVLSQLIPAVYDG